MQPLTREDNMTTEELVKERLKVLAQREENRAKGSDMVLAFEEACNAKLRNFNLAIQGVQPYQEEEKPAPKRRTRKKKDVLA